MKTINCTGIGARETEKRIWEYTDKGYQFAYSQFDNPTFIKYGENGKVIDGVSFIHNYIDLSYSRKA